MKKKIKIYKSIVFVIVRNKYELKLINTINFLIEKYYKTYLVEKTDSTDFERGCLYNDISILLDSIYLLSLTEPLKLLYEDELINDDFNDLLVLEKSFNDSFSRDVFYGLI